MRWEIPEKIRSEFTPTTSESVVVLEAARMLYGCTFNAARCKFPAIKFEHEPFVRNRDATVWELELGERLANALREDFLAERSWPWITRT